MECFCSTAILRRPVPKLNENFLRHSPHASWVAAGFVLGVLFIQCRPELPPVWMLGVGTLLAFLLVRVRKPFFAACLVGGVWAAGWGLHGLGERVPFKNGRTEVSVEGEVVSLPDTLDKGVRFDFRVDTALGSDGSPVPRKIRLNWFDRDRQIHAGEHWQLRVSLRPLHGMANPGGFDYEGWLFAEGIGAVGYVRESSDNRLMKSPGISLRTLRQTLRERIRSVLGDSPMSGLVVALALGDESGISNSQWDVLRRTGTAHLVAVSGSHIGLVAGLVFWLVRSGYVRMGGGRWSLPALAAVAAMVGAWFYAALSGFAIPAQRAAIMVTVVMSAILLQRNVVASHVMALAVLAVLIHDPLAVLSPGFWLSFGAVGLIVWAMAGSQGSQGLRAFLRINWVTALGLAPLLLLFFGQISLVSPLANLVAVPVLGTLLIPVCLMGALLLTGIPMIGEWLLKMAASILSLIWPLMDMMSSWSWAQWTHPQPPFWRILLALSGGLLLLSPRGVPSRWLGLVLMIPAVLFMPVRLEPGQFRLTLLDVGQGLSAVLETRHRTLVFDAGARLSPGFDMGKAVITPYLRFRGIRRLDTLIVSHGDNDHAGGARSLLAEFPAGEFYTSAPGMFVNDSPESCKAGMHWRWDGVEFTLLGPAPAFEGKENDRSCVLRVAAAAGSVLLTGDIERVGENALIQQWGNGLHSDVVVVPHHGSKSSSTSEFIRAVQPRMALIPVGYLNRFGFPAASVVERYRHMGADIWSTAQEGAITFETGHHGQPSWHIDGWRQIHPNYWTSPRAIRE